MILSKWWLSILETYPAQRCWDFSSMALMLVNFNFSRTSILVMKSLQWMLRLMLGSTGWIIWGVICGANKWSKTELYRRVPRLYTRWSLCPSSGVCCTPCVYVVCRMHCLLLPACCQFPCQSWYLMWWCTSGRWSDRPLSTQLLQWWYGEGGTLPKVQAGGVLLSSLNWLLAQRTR